MARWPTSKGVLFFLLALAASACSSDLFHSTEWKTVCDTNSPPAGCGEGGGGGSDGGATPGNCVSCLELAPVAEPPPTSEVCPESRDAYALLNDCRCVTSCAMACASAPACGGGATALVACETCTVQKCGVFIEACGAPAPKPGSAPAPMP